MKTAMQQLIEFLEPELKMHDFLQLPAYEKAKGLLEEEKQQIIEAVKYGQNNSSLSLKNEEEIAKNYYTKTFEKK